MVSDAANGTPDATVETIDLNFSYPGIGATSYGILVITARLDSHHVARWV